MAEMPDYDAIVNRLRANLDKYPGFVNLNAEAAAAIDALLAQRKVLAEEVEAWRLWYTACQPSPQHGLDVGTARAAVDAAFPEGLPK